MESVKVNSANLSRLREQVSVPGYDRDKLDASVVHVGLGNFHRAHQAA
jgi:mannitol 2-dehydrogenase